MRRWVTAAACAFGSCVALLAQNPRTVHNVGPETFTRRVVAAGLADPWEITWGPDERLWVTERTAFRVVRVNPADGAITVALTMDDVYQASVQDGLMGLALHPELLKKKGLDYVYVAYTYDRDPGPDVTRRLRVRRYTFDARSQSLTAPITVLDDLPAHDDHGGGRLVMGPDGKLYLSRGDLGSNFLANYCNAIRAQDLPTADQVRDRDWTTYQGKILRLNLDGSIPQDNPTIAGVRSHVYTYGHRNTQGMAFGPGGLLYASEHGPSTDDELNVLAAGKNYGWPDVAGFNDDRGYVYANWSASAPAPCRTLKFDNLHPPASVPQQKESQWRHPDFVPPIATFFTVPPAYDLGTLGNATIAPAGIDVYHAPAIPGWATSVLITGMRTGAVYRVRLDAGGRAMVGQPIEYFKSNDRYRDSALSPDGRRIYLSTDSMGTTMDAQGGRTDVLTSPGAILEFTFARAPGSK
jgi:PQQ-dependent dehydrogenase (s-GDH family)